MRSKIALGFIALIFCALAGCKDGPTTETISGPSQAYAAVNGPTASTPITAFSSNPSTTVTNIHVVSSSIPNGVEIQYQSANGGISANGCASTANGQSCTLLITGNGEGSSGNYTLQVISDNSNSLTLPLNLQWPSLTLTTSGLTNQSYTLLLTNASQVTASNISYSLPTTPSGWTVDTSVATCHPGQNLNANASCILAAITDSTAGDPTPYNVTANGGNFDGEETLYGFSPYCANNISTFTPETDQSPYYVPPGDNNISAGVAWGPFPFLPISGDSTVLACAANNAWQAQRVLATANYWIGQKVNYCHHHVPTWLTPSDVGGVNYQNDNNCSTTPDIEPGANNNVLIRWNYSGSIAQNQSAQDWQNTNMWYGLDCSDYTSLIYNFGMEAPLMTSGVAAQAGQACPETPPPAGCSTWITTLTPNQQTLTETLFSPSSVDANQNIGAWVCMDGTTDRSSYSGTSNFCGNLGGTNHGGYISVLDKDGNYNANAITPEVLTKLQPGDLLYFGMTTNANNIIVWSPEVIHVMMWTGKKVGYGVNDINPAQIAPEEHCPQSDWQPQIGDWVITDSHYQGPDYRVFTNCYYGEHLWGVRRIIGVSAS